jgi:CBS domain-containing protein
MAMFEYDNMEPRNLVEPESLMSPRRELPRLSRSEGGRSTPIRALPIKQPLLLASETTVAEAAQLMMEEDARVALIVSGERVLGIVTEDDVWRAMSVHFAG